MPYEASTSTANVFKNQRDTWEEITRFGQPARLALIKSEGADLFHPPASVRRGYISMTMKNDPNKIDVERGVVAPGMRPIITL